MINFMISFFYEIIYILICIMKSNAYIFHIYIYISWFIYLKKNYVRAPRYKNFYNFNWNARRTLSLILCRLLRALSTLVLIIYPCLYHILRNIRIYIILIYIMLNLHYTVIFALGKKSFAVYIFQLTCIAKYHPATRIKLSSNKR